MSGFRRIGSVRQGFARLVLLAFAACPGRADVAGEPDPEPVSAEVLELRDPDLIARVWRIVHGDSVLPPGEFQVLLPAPADLPLPGGERGPDAGADAVLLRNGTMEGRLDRGAWEQAAALSRRDKVLRWKEDWEEPESGYIPTLWTSFRVDRERIARWTEWPAGIRFELASAMSLVPSSSPQFERQIDIEWNQKLYRHFLLGAGLYRTEFGGGLVRSARSAEAALAPDPRPSRPDFWTEPFWWWSLSAGVPGVRYTLFLADRPLPGYYWLETRASSLIRDRKAGKVVKQWADSALSRSGNVGQSLDLRLAHVRYRLNWDGEAYAAAVQAVELDDLPAFFGHWGAGVVMAGDVAATRVWMDIPDFAFSLARPTAYPSRFRFAFLHFDLAYRNLRNFHLGASITARLDNPILNLPGAGK